MARAARWPLSFALALALAPGCYTLDFNGDGFADRGPVAGYETDEVSCSNGRDDDLDGLTDCRDPDCIMRGFCAEIIPDTSPLGVENTYELCTNGIDDDLDGTFDCGDRDCQSILELCCAAEFNDATCSDGIDNDGNGQADCRDFGCRNNPYVTVCAFEFDCANGRDDDGDRLIDCRDPDCREFHACRESNCSDGIDNDGNGFIDCADPSCTQEQGCPPPESICDNGVDDDGDGLTDCRDPDCWSSAACLGPENTLARCMDRIDNDRNGFIDCADFGCLRSTDPDIVAYCASVTETTLAQCSDGFDNDGNGFTDCNDFSCSRSSMPDVLAYCESIAENTLERCFDGIDNDGNGFTDCNDFSCSRSTNVEVAERCRQLTEGTFELCTDGRDNDRNGFTDCGDFSCRFTRVARTGLCATHEECPAGQSCYRGSCLRLESPCIESMWLERTTVTQGNEDRSIPTDTTMAERIAMAVRSCTDGIDNDRDGFTDCEDWECNHNPLVVDAEGNPICRRQTGRTCIAGPLAGRACAGDEDCMIAYTGACARPGGRAGRAFVCP